MSDVAERLLRRAASRDPAARPSAADARLMAEAAGAIRMAEAQTKAAEERDQYKLRRAASVMAMLMKDGAECDDSKRLLARLRDPEAAIGTHETIRFNHSSDHVAAREASQARDALGDAVCRIWRLQDSYAAPFPAKVVAILREAWGKIPQEVRSRNGCK